MERRDFGVLMPNCAASATAVCPDIHCAATRQGMASYVFVMRCFRRLLSRWHLTTVVGAVQRMKRPSAFHVALLFSLLLHGVFFMATRQPKESIGSHALAEQRVPPNSLVPLAAVLRPVPVPQQPTPALRASDEALPKEPPQEINPVPRTPATSSGESAIKPMIFLGAEEIEVIPYPWQGLDLSSVVHESCGHVRFQIGVTHLGKVEEISLDESSFSSSDTDAINALIRRTPFRPGRKDGTAVDATVPLDVTLTGSNCS